MEQYAFKDVTLRIFREILDEPEFRDWPDVGIAIQAYLRDTEARPARPARLGEAARHAGLGAAGEGGVLGLRDGDRGPERLAGAGLHAEVADRRELRAADRASCWRTTTWLRPAFGSHNVRSLAHALAAAERAGRAAAAASSSRCSTAWPTRSRTRFGRSGQRVRVYTPYGELLPGMAYLVRRLLENTSNESFLRAELRRETCPRSSC